MNVFISPSALCGAVTARSSKAEAHRALICAAICGQPTKVIINDACRDTDATVRCLRALGAEITVTGSLHRVSMVPTEVDKRQSADYPVLDCGESGSTLRFLLPVAMALHSRVGFIGSGRLPERPLSGLTDCMSAHGVTFSANRLPFEATGKLTGGSFQIYGNISSQFVSGLMLALPMINQGGDITLTTPLESAPYVAMTRKILSDFGVNYEFDGRNKYTLTGNNFCSPHICSVGGDWSNSAAFFVAALGGKGVTVNGLDINSCQGDRAVVDILTRMGARINIGENSVTVLQSRLHGCEIDISSTPDLLPVLAVAAAAADGETRFINSSRLRLKESDRLCTTAALINATGGSARETGDTLIVNGGVISGGEFDAHNDHRLVMAAAVAGTLSRNGVTIHGAQAIEKSYVSFFDDYCSLGGKLNVL